MFRQGFLCILAVVCLLISASPAHALRKRRQTLQNPVQSLVGKWQDLEGETLFILCPEGGDSLIRLRGEGSTTYFPISWSATTEKLTITYTAEPYMETIDPMFEAFWRPQKPRQPEPLAFTLSRDGNELTLGKDATFRRYRE